jgi:hypothetical protein
VNVRPLDSAYNTTEDISLQVEIERLWSNRKSLGNNAPPDDSFFKTELNSEAEAVVTTALARSISHSSGGWCFMQSDSDPGLPAERSCDRTLSSNKDQ